MARATQRWLWVRDCENYICFFLLHLQTITLKKKQSVDKTVNRFDVFTTVYENTNHEVV